MIKVRSKTLFIPAEEQSIGAVGEADSTVREFHIDRVSGDGVDLANLLFKLNIRYAGVREIDRSDLEKVVTDNAIILRWLISSVTLRNAGTAFLQLDAFDETGSCRWKSYPGAVYIEKSIGTEDIPKSSLSELEQLEKRFTQIGDGEKARVEAEKKRVSAEEKREEAEGKRNTSLANIIAEEEKIKALSTETKGYRDSVKTDKDAITADKQAITAIKNEAVSARETAQQHASAAEASKNNTITEGVKIKEAVINLKNEANTAKTDAVNAKNEAVSAKNGANTIKGEVLALKNEANTIMGEVRALKNETESRIQSAESNIQNQVMNATSYAGMAERSSQQAEGYKMEASTSAQKAKESETKTLEALAKAQEGGNASGVTTEEMKSYVDTAVGKVKSGITEVEAKERFLDKSELNGAVTPLVENAVKGKIDREKVTDIEVDYSRLLDNLKNGLGEIPIPSGKLATTDVLQTIFAVIRNDAAQRLGPCYKMWEEEQYVGGKSINSRVGEPESEEVPVVLSTLRNRLRTGKYGRIKIFDYIDIPTTIPGTEKMRFYVMAIDRDLEKNSIDFVSFDYPDRIILPKTFLENYRLGDIGRINKSVESRMMNDERIPELMRMLNRGTIIKETALFPNPGRVDPYKCKIWTLDLGDVVGVPFPLGRVDGADITFASLDRLEFFKKKKRVKDIMKADMYLTSSTNSEFVAVVDKTLTPRKRTKTDTFGELPEGTSQEEKLRLRPAIPICFRICAD